MTTGLGKENIDKTQFGKDAVDDKDGELSNASEADLAETQQPKVAERQRSSTHKYTGSTNLKVLMVGTGEVAKLVAAKADEKEALYDRIAAEGRSASTGGSKASAEIQKTRKSVELKKLTREHKVEDSKKLSRLDGLQKYRAEAEKPEAGSSGAVSDAPANLTRPAQDYASNSNAPAQVRYPDGKQRNFVFDAAGDVCEIRFHDPAKGYKDSWIKQPDTELWEHFDAKGQKTGKQFDGGIGIDEQGNVTYVPTGSDVATVETSDGKQWTFYKNGAGVLVDAKGRIEEIDYPNDTHAQFSHDDNGELIDVQFPDGIIWRKGDADEWFPIDNNGEAVDGSDPFYGRIDVAKDGSIKMTDTTGNTASFNGDGSRTTIYNDGSIVETNPEGFVSKVIYPASKHSSIVFGYSETGELNSIDHGNELVWKKVQGTRWKSAGTDEIWDGEVLVNADGSYTVKESGQPGRLTENTNGSKVMHLADGTAQVDNIDGSLVSVDKNGFIRAIDYPQGQKRDFNYDGSDLIEVNYEDTELNFKDTWRKEKDFWIQYQDGQPTGKRWAGVISVDQSTGEFMYQSKASAELSVEKTDGSVLTINDDGIKNVRTAYGDEYQFVRNAAGTITSFTDPTGMTWTLEGVDSWRNGDGHLRVGSASVGEDGTLIFRTSDKARFEFTGGTAMEMTSLGGRLLYDRSGQLVETIDTEKRVHKFGYNEQNQINKVVGPDGVTWLADVGDTWLTPDGKQEWKGSVHLADDGLITIFDSERNLETTFSLDGGKQERPVGTAPATKEDAGQSAAIQQLSAASSRSSSEYSGRPIEDRAKHAVSHPVPEPISEPASDLVPPHSSESVSAVVSAPVSAPVSAAISEPPSVPPSVPEPSPESPLKPVAESALSFGEGTAGDAPEEFESAPQTILPKPASNGTLIVLKVTDYFGGPEVKPNGQSLLGSKIYFEVDGEAYELVRQPGDSFFYDRIPSARQETASVKLHVNVVDENDLARLQAVLIPALKKNEHLRTLVMGWKTLDPRFGTEGKSPVVTLGPTGKNRGAKGFIIFIHTSGSAWSAHKRIDSILAQYPELCWATPLDTNNVEVIAGQSNRVGLARDRYDRALDAPATELRVAIEKEVATRILNDSDLACRAAANRTSIVEQLERDCGLMPNTLHVNTAGNFSLTLSAQNRRDFDQYEKFVYVQETDAGKQAGRLRDRTALFALYRRYSVDWTQR